MTEIDMSGSMSGEGKRSVAAWPKPPRLSSTLHWLSKLAISTEIPESNQGSPT